MAWPYRAENPLVMSDASVRMTGGTRSPSVPVEASNWSFTPRPSITNACSPSRPPR